MEPREHGNEFAAAHTGDLRRNFLADATDLIPLRGGGGAQFSRQFRRFAVQASKGFVRELYFHALHTATLVTLIEDRKSNSGQHAGPARFVVPDAISFQGSGDHGDRTTIKFCICSGTIKIFLEWGTFGVMVH